MTIRKLLFATGLLLCASFNLQTLDSNASEIKSNAPMPLPFTKNMGQWPDSILFRASANGATMWFTKNGIWYQFFRRVEKSDASASWAVPPLSGISSAPNSVGGASAVGGSSTDLGGPSTGRVPVNDFPGKFGHDPDSIETTMIKAEFVGTSESVEVLGLEELEYKCNYFIGNDESQWRTDVPNYSVVTMRGLYPGVDVTFASKEGQLQEELTTSTSGSLTQVKVEYRGADGVIPQTPWAADGTSAPVLDEHSGYAPRSTVHTSFGEHSFEGILLTDGSASNSERQVSSASSTASGVSLVYSTYLGGSYPDYGNDLAVDAEGNAYVSGYTLSPNFPTQNPLQSFIRDSYDAFVTKLNSAGTGLIYSTYLGGTWDETESSIAVDGGGNAYITGTTMSPDFPIQNPFQPSYSDGMYDAFVTKLNSAGNGLLYSTYLGGVGYDHGLGIAVDAGGNCYVTGSTSSPDFPTQNAFQDSIVILTNDETDAFVTKLNGTGTGLIYSTYLGGGSDDVGSGIAVDDVGNAYVTGITSSTDFPTQNPFQPIKYYYDAFVTKLDISGSGLIYSTFLGGSGYDNAHGIAVDAGGNAYVTGYTESSNFPLQNPFHTDVVGSSDAFVTRFNGAGNGLIYSTYLGGNGLDIGTGIAVDTEGNACIIGVTISTNFPTQNPLQAFKSDFYDAFVTKFNGYGVALLYSTYLGGDSDDLGNGIAVDAGGNAYVTGLTWSTNFPIQNPFQASLGSDWSDAFATKLTFVPCCVGSRGNVDGDAGDAVNVSDVTYLAQFLFQGGAAPLCIEETDVAVNNRINVVDLVRLVNYLFGGGPALQACP